MGILDDAIKEHLELKRRHGAGDSELKQLEDEAFGPLERPGAEEAAPDPFAEAPTEFMAQPEAAEEAPARRRAPDIAELQEAPEHESGPVAEEEPPPEEESPAEAELPAEYEPPAMEHEAIHEHELRPGEPEAELEPGETDAALSTEERHAIAEEPTQLYDVEGEFAASEPRAPSEEELVEEEIGEPRLAPVDPLAGTVEEDEEEADDEEEDDFFDEQRLSDELDQALEAPGGLELEPEEEDFEPEEDLEPEKEPASTRSDEGGEPASTRSDEDLLEETPDFLEEAPEDDRLWFEQKPPKDFDFDD